MRDNGEDSAAESELPDNAIRSSAYLRAYPSRPRTLSIWSDLAGRATASHWVHAARRPVALPIPTGAITRQLPNLDPGLPQDAAAHAPSAFVRRQFTSAPFRRKRSGDERFFLLRQRVLIVFMGPVLVRLLACGNNQERYRDGAVRCCLPEDLCAPKMESKVQGYIMRDTGCCTSHCVEHHLLDRWRSVTADSRGRTTQSSAAAGSSARAAYGRKVANR